MRFIVESAKLLKTLNDVNGVISSVNTMPILDNFLFVVKENKLTVVASDIETTISKSVELERSEGDCEIVVPSKIFDLAKRLPSAESNMVEISIDTVVPTIEVRALNGKYKYSGFNADEYPKFDVGTLENNHSFTIPSISLKRAIDKTLFAVAKDVMRPVFCGVCLNSKDDKVSFIATDAHKLVSMSFPNDNPTDVEVSSVIAKKPLSTLKNIIPSTDAPITVEYNPKNVRFIFGDTVVVSKLIEGKYPNCRAIIPQNNNKELKIDRQSLLQALQRLAIFASEVTHNVVLELGVNALTIKAEDSDIETNGTETLQCHYDGGELRIGFNVRYLQEMLSKIDTTDVLIKLSEANKPALILPVMESENDNKEQMLFLLMPIVLD